MNRSAKDGVRSSPHYGGEGVTHSPIVPRCLLAARYGRFMCDPRRPVGVLVFFNQVSDPISESEMGSDARAGVGERHGVRWAAHESWGLKSPRCSDEGRCIQKRG
jgi:hypothetical protein